MFVRGMVELREDDLIGFGEEMWEEIEAWGVGDGDVESCGG